MEPEIASAFAELGLRPDASDADVKSAWRRLVSQWHPDRNDSAAAVARMQRINRAVEAIRQAAAAAEQMSPAAAPAAPPQARSVHRKLRLSLEEAAFGCTRRLRGRCTAVCTVCDGAGHHGPAAACADCQGSGSLRQGSWFNWLGNITPCPACKGLGQVLPACVACAGRGKAAAAGYQVSVRLPHGVRAGDLLVVPAAAGQAGVELNLRIEIDDHPLFTLQADGTLACTVPVDGFAWAAQRPVEVPTLGGVQPLQLRRDQLQVRLAGEGFPVERRGPRGDLLVTVLPVFPERLSQDQQSLLDRLIASTSGPEARQTDARLRDWNRALRARRR